MKFIRFWDFKNIFIFSFILLMFSVEGVSAADLNETSGIVLSDDLVVENSFLGSNGLNFESAAKNTNDVNVSSSGTFDDLQKEIRKAPEGSTLDLFRDYNGRSGFKITLSKDLTIDGHGHTLNCLGEKDCSAFYSKKGKYCIKKSQNN